MSLYNDLTTVLTPYANKIKQNESDIGDIQDGLSTINESLDDVKADLSELSDVLTVKSYVDVPLTFDISGFYKNGNLNRIDASITDAKTCLINVAEGDSYRVTGQSNYDQKLACVYDADNNILLTIMPENNTQVLTEYEFTIPTGGVKMSLSYLHNYAEYWVTLQKAEISAKKIGVDGVDFFEKIKPQNLFDYKTAVYGSFMNPNGSLSQNTNTWYSYIPVGEGTFVVNVSTSIFGRTVAARIPVFDAEKKYLTFIYGTYFDDSTGPLVPLKISIPKGVKYIGLSGTWNYQHRVMVVNSESVPTDYLVYFGEYIALEGTEKIKAENVKGGEQNPLYLKTVAFDGDSICNGSSAQDGKNGWAGRIGNANEMNWENYGIGGGTITNNHSHCILNFLDTIHNYMPPLDYYIFDGGTNDADHLGSAGIGTLTPNDYSGNYDTATFTGAFEKLLYNALTYYPTTKIGYIVAQKMGKTNNANYAIRKAYFDRAIEICKKWGIPYIDLWDGSPLNPNLSSMYDASLDTQGNIDAKKLYVDGQHLTPTGYDYITPIIEAWMKTL